MNGEGGIRSGPICQHYAAAQLTFQVIEIPGFGFPRILTVVARFLTVLR